MSTSQASEEQALDITEGMIIRAARVICDNQDTRDPWPCGRHTTQARAALVAALGEPGKEQRREKGRMKLWVTDDEFGEDFQVDVPVASVVAALIAEGGEIVEARYRIAGWNPVMEVPKHGRYLVYGPLPVESAEAKET